MPRGALSVVALLSCCALAAQEKRDLVPPAAIELLVPAGATVVVEGGDFGARRTLTLDDLKPNEIRRVRFSVRFADGSSDERLVDISAGQRVPVPVPAPGPDKPATITIQPPTPITAAALSRDGRFVAVGLESHAVVLWDAADGRPVRTFSGHQKPVLSVAFSRDAKHLLSGSADATAILWDADTGAQLRAFKGHTGSVLSVAFAPDAESVLTGSADGTARAWNAHSGEVVHTLKGHTKEVMAVAYSPDGRTLATASADSTAALWAADTGKQSVVLRGHGEGVTSLAFSPDGARVGTGSYENVGIVWDAATGKRLATTGRHGNDVYSVAFTADGRRVLTGDREELVMMWDAATGQPVRTFAGHSADVVSLAATADGRTLLTGSRDGTAKLWDLATGRELLALTTDAARKTWAAVAPDGLFDGSESGRRAVGFRFAKQPGGEADQFFNDCYRPGLLVDVWRGQRPVLGKPLGMSKPPLVKLVPLKSRVFAAPEAAVEVDVTDQGGGVSDLIVENNGVRVAVARKSAPTADAKTARVTFTVPLTPGANRLRVKAASADGSWESAGAEVELAHPRTPGQKGRMYVVAVGVSAYPDERMKLAFPAKDAQALADLFQTRGATLYDRVDAVRLLDRDATKTAIEDAVKDVAELTRPQDALVVLLCGHGAIVGDRPYFAPHDLRVGRELPHDALRSRGVAVGDLAAAMGTAPALRRALVVDTAASGSVFDGALKGRGEFALRGAVERWARAHGVHALAAAPDDARAGEDPKLGRGLLAHSLLSAADEPGAVLDVADWLPRAARVVAARPGVTRDVQTSSQAKGFPLLQSGK